jgi:hypothetical protein
MKPDSGLKESGCGMWEPLFNKIFDDWPGGQGRNIIKREVYIIEIHGLHNMNLYCLANQVPGRR